MKRELGADENSTLQGGGEDPRGRASPPALLRKLELTWPVGAGVGGPPNAYLVTAPLYDPEGGVGC